MSQAKDIIRKREGQRKFLQIMKTVGDTVIDMNDYLVNLKQDSADNVETLKAIVEGDNKSINQLDDIVSTLKDSIENTTNIRFVKDDIDVISQNLLTDVEKALENDNVLSESVAKDLLTKVSESNDLVVAANVNRQQLIEDAFARLKESDNALEAFSKELHSHVALSNERRNNIVIAIEMLMDNDTKFTERTNELVEILELNKTLNGHLVDEVRDLKELIKNLKSLPKPQQQNLTETINISDLSKQLEHYLNDTNENADEMSNEAVDETVDSMEESNQYTPLVHIPLPHTTSDDAETADIIHFVKYDDNESDTTIQIDYDEAFNLNNTPATISESFNDVDLVENTPIIGDTVIYDQNQDLDVSDQGDELVDNLEDDFDQNDNAHDVPIEDDSDYENDIDYEDDENDETTELEDLYSDLDLEDIPVEPTRKPGLFQRIKNMFKK